MVAVDTLIVGAGPAGAAAAITLARAGRETLVVDRAEFPRDKCCGDGLTTMALRELEALGWSPRDASTYTRVRDVAVRSPSGRVIDFTLPDAGHYAAVVQRAELDQSLVDLVRVTGAHVLEGSAIESIDANDDGALVGIDGMEPLRASHVIAADGMWSPTRKLLGLASEKYLGDWHGFRQYFTNVAPSANRLWVWFEEDLLPGYVWSFPLGESRANVGFGILRGGDLAVRDMKALWPDVLARPHIAEILGSDARPEDPHRAWPIPARIGQLPLAHGPVLFAGDAAAATDPLTGEGIGQALLTGRLAAETLLSTRHHPTIARRYEADVTGHLHTDHRLASALGTLLSKRLTARAAVRVAGATPWTRRNFVRWMFEDYPRAVLATPRRWADYAQRTPGAFGSVGPERQAVSR